MPCERDLSRFEAVAWVRAGAPRARCHCARAWRQPLRGGFEARFLMSMSRRARAAWGRPAEPLRSKLFGGGRWEEGSRAHRDQVWCR